MIAVNDPRGSSTLTPSRATTAASPLPWTLRTSRRATAGAEAAVSGECGVDWTWSALSRPRRGSPIGPACVLLSARWCRHGRPAVPCAALRARLESAGPDDQLDALGRRSARPRRSSGRASARRGPQPADGPHAQPVVLGGAVDGGRRRELRRADPGALRPRAADGGQRRDPLALGHVVRGVRPRRVAPAPRQRGRADADDRGFRRARARGPGAGRLAGRVHARPALRRAVDRGLRGADPQLRGRWPAHVERRRGDRPDVLLRALRPAVRGDAVPARRAQPAARVAQRRRRGGAHQGPVRCPGRCGARRRGRHRAALALGLATAPARAAAEPRRQPVRPAVCREPHHADRWLALDAADVGTERGAAHRPGGAALGPAALAARARGLPDLFRELGTLRGARLEAGLAATLGDPELVLAYRVPDQHAFIDGAGRPVELPEPVPAVPPL